ncbi:MAG: 4Fe-4S binding protein [Candidatus Bathyarchaeia archaeon]
MGRVEICILKDLCKGCGLCIHYCPRNVLEWSDEINVMGVHPPKVVNKEECTLCNFCSLICPDLAIFIKERLDAR